MSVALNIRKVRKERGLTISQLAEKSGVSMMSMRRYEIGEREPKISDLSRIAEVLDVSVEYLLGLESVHAAKMRELAENNDARGMEKLLDLPEGSIMIPTQEQIKEFEEKRQRKALTQQVERVSDDDIKIALFGGGGEVTDEMWEEAKFAIELIKERNRRKNQNAAPPDTSDNE